MAFAICLLENYNADLKFPQALVIVPTREIAVQIVAVLNELGRNQKHFVAREFIGGCEIANDRKKIQTTKVIVGTPGRVLHLINNQVFNISNIKTLVLDEADKLLESGKMAKDVTAILKAMERKIQILAATATVSDHMEKTLKKYMKNPIGITPKHEIPVLLGIKQFVKVLPTEDDNIALMNAKIDHLVNIFARITFKQCLLFTDSQSKTESYSNYLNKQGWKNEVISGAQEQSHRLEVLNKLINFKCRILIATDLMARGIDVENINLIINLDLPYDCFTYLHRIGRAGRFGSHGLAITFLNGEKDLQKFQKILGDIGGESVKALMFPEETYDFWNFDSKNDETLEFVAGNVNSEETNLETAVEETVMNNIALMEMARKLVDNKSEAKQFDLNAILEDYEKNSSEEITSISNGHNHDEALNNIFLETVNSLKLNGNDDRKESDKENSKDDATDEKEVRQIIFKRDPEGDEELFDDSSNDSDFESSQDEEEGDTSFEEEDTSCEEVDDIEDVQQHPRKPQHSPMQRESVQPNLSSIYHQYVSNNYSKWENIYNFQLANIQNYLEVNRKS